ncbi:hypothetical protein Aab01nite_20250 [Paractinoplanes abujensis]|uniref:Phenylalanyl-tRNA synthetase alpha chain n=1 Tax=Paractinoplanes abujensis TaxID=882441 RepID=A0A7W7G7K1_9ACTN|nr:hypothetical protein [Actinoplanes abujensis]MBB4697091.1 phenylalanyl-tRNA synthetase alpha chain [Actinoplanes abujensis]GID18435.1 hypothetical protein Aab01nite_20250 [Actinoplanes abujensis]
MTPENIRDLTDPTAGPHAIQAIVDAAVGAAHTLYPDAAVVVHRGDRIVDVADNYDRLGYSPSAAARDSRYTRYVDARRMLRSQTSALIPGALRHLSVAEALIVCPGLVYRRDSIDRLHTGTPHQLDLWWVGPAADGDLGAGLVALVGAVVGATLPDAEWRTRPADHPYTTGGLEIEARVGDAWVEIGECGVAAEHVIGPVRRGLALGLGLDRLLMLRKGVDDIRLLRSADPRVREQMLDLSPYRPVSAQPAARRDLSVALPAGVTAEDLGDRVRELLGPEAHLVEEVAIESITPPDALPKASRERLGIRDGEVNVLLRVVLRDLRRALPKQTANALRDRLYAGLMTGRPGRGERGESGEGVECAVDDGDGFSGQQGPIAA